MYADADVYLLDDPLSAVDAKVAYKLFHNCIMQLVKEGKAVVLTTHQVQFLSNVQISHLTMKVERVYEINEGFLHVLDGRE